MKRLILLDLNNFGFAAMSQPVLTSGEKDTHAIFGVLKRVRAIIEAHPEARVLCLDDGRSWRHDVYSEYKANRGKNDKQAAQISSYKEQKADIVTGLKLLGVGYVIAANLEADDLAEILTRNAADKGFPVTLLTADGDWKQLVRRNVNWVDLIHNQTCRYETFKSDTGYKDARQFAEAKCILGDTGDNIKGVLGVGPKALEGIYALCDNVGDFLLLLEKDRKETEERWFKVIGKKMPKALRELDIPATRDTVAKNAVLMDLTTSARPKAVDLRKECNPLDADAFELFAHRNAFMSITRQMDLFLEPFRKNKYVGIR